MPILLGVRLSQRFRSPANPIDYCAAHSCTHAGAFVSTMNTVSGSGLWTCDQRAVTSHCWRSLSQCSVGRAERYLIVSEYGDNSIVVVINRWEETMHFLGFGGSQWITIDSSPHLFANTHEKRPRYLRQGLGTSQRAKDNTCGSIAVWAMPLTTDTGLLYLYWF